MTIAANIQDSAVSVDPKPRLSCETLEGAGPKHIVCEEDFKDEAEANTIHRLSFFFNLSIFKVQSFFLASLVLFLRCLLRGFESLSFFAFKFAIFTFF